MPGFGLSGFAAPGIGLGTPGFGVQLGPPTPSVTLADPPTLSDIDAELGLNEAPDLGAVANVDAMGNPLGWSNVAPNPPAVAFDPAPPPDAVTPTPNLGYPPNAPITPMEQAIMGKMDLSIDPHMAVPPNVPTPLQPDIPMVDPNMLGLPLQSIPAPPMVTPIAFQTPMTMTQALDALGQEDSGFGDEGDAGDAGDAGEGGSGGIGSEGGGGGGSEGGGSGGIGSEGGGGGIGGGGVSGGIGSEGGGGGIGGGGSTGGIGSEGGGGGAAGAGPAGGPGEGGSSGTGGIGSEGGGGGPGGGDAGDAGEGGAGV